jgi:two-component system cell cycle sensor histidine kinase/response regulator CckA
MASTERGAIKSQPTGATVLIVEDDATVLWVMRRTLESEGYRVLAARSPLEGIHLYEREADSITLLIADIMMPDLTGPEMVAKLNERWPELPVLYVSGYADSVQLAAVGQQGAPLLPKPFMPTALLDKVRELIDRV